MGCVVVAGVFAARAITDGGEDYRLRAQFANAGQVVKGGRVMVAGKEIGKISAVRLSDGGLADVEFRVHDAAFVPLRAGTRVAIRSVGQATLTNRYLDVGPGSVDGDPLSDGAVIPIERTQGIVDLDQILNAADADMRGRLQAVIGNLGDVYAGSGAPTFNALLEALDPTLGSATDLLVDLSSDAAMLKRVVVTGRRLAETLRVRAPDLQDAVQGTATTMTALDRERQQVSSAVRAAPRVVGKLRTTFREIGTTAAAFRPTLRAVPAVTPGLTGLLDSVARVLPASQYGLKRLDAFVPRLSRGVRELGALEEPAVDALRSTGRGLADSTHILEGLRYYGSDLVLGVINGLTGISSGQYNQFGKYLKLEFIQSPQTAPGGILAPLLPALTGGAGLLPGIMNTATNLRNRCPGGNAPPAPDGSSPWYPKAGICDPRQSMSGLVNSPTATCRTQNDCIGDRRSLEPEGEVPARPDNGGSR